MPDPVMPPPGYGRPPFTPSLPGVRPRSPIYTPPANNSSSGGGRMGPGGGFQENNQASSAMTEFRRPGQFGGSRQPQQAFPPPQPTHQQNQAAQDSSTQMGAIQAQLAQMRENQPVSDPYGNAGLNERIELQLQERIRNANLEYQRLGMLGTPQHMAALEAAQTWAAESRGGNRQPGQNPFSWFD